MCNLVVAILQIRTSLTKPAIRYYCGSKLCQRNRLRPRYNAITTVATMTRNEAYTDHDELYNN